MNEEEAAEMTNRERDEAQAEALRKSCEFEHPHPSRPCGRRQPELRPQRFVCRDCGYGVKADEDGCCATCGRDCAVVEIVSVPEDWSARIRAAALGDEDEGPG